MTINEEDLKPAAQVVAELRGALLPEYIEKLKGIIAGVQKRVIQILNNSRSGISSLCSSTDITREPQTKSKKAG
jgi:hypothetical protein